MYGPAVRHDTPLFMLDDAFSWSVFDAFPSDVTYSDFDVQLLDLEICDEI